MSSRLDIAIYALKSILNMDLSVVRMKARSTAINALDQIEGMPSNEDEDILSLEAGDWASRFRQAADRVDELERELQVTQEKPVEVRLTGVRATHEYPSGEPGKTEVPSGTVPTSGGDPPSDGSNRDR